MPATLKSRLPGIAAELQPRVSNAVKDGAEKIAVTAQRNLEAGGHSRTGDLLGAIHVERVGPAEYAVLAGDKGVFYGHFVEGGTDIAPAYPFLLPALEENRDEVASEVQNVLRTL